MAGVITQKAKEIRTAENALINAAAGSDSKTPEQQADEARRRDLLSRDRGFFGTIQTGFRGGLSLAQPGQRKTLLGE